MPEKYEQEELVFSDDKETSHEDLGPLIYSEPEPDVQPDLPVGDNEEGYNYWQAANRKRIQSISDEWNVPLYKNIMVSLKNVPGTLTGKLLLREDPKEPFNSKKQNLFLVLDDIEFKLDNKAKTRPEFMSDEIESWKLIP